MANGFNPEHILRERVFQKAVDRTGIDPQKAKWSLFHLFAVGMLLSCAAVVTLFSDSSAPDFSLSNYAALLIIYLGTIYMIRVQVVLPQPVALGFVATYMRMLYALGVVLFIFLSFFNAASPNPGPLVARLGMYGMTLSWIFGVSAAYLNVCRRPPPRKREGSAKVAFQNA